MELKKSYKELLLFLLLFAGIIVGCSFIKVDVSILTVIYMLSVFAWVTLLILYMLLMDRAYWITGLDYEACKKATKEERKKYMTRILYRFLLADIVFVIYSIFGIVFKFPSYGTTIVAGSIIVAAAISTVFVKLQDEK